MSAGSKLGNLHTGAQLTDAQVDFLIRWGDYYADENSEEGRVLFPDTEDSGPVPWVSFEPRELMRELAREVKAARQCRDAGDHVLGPPYRPGR